MLRHGRTAWNEEGRFQGHSDVPLDAVGRAQAEMLARYLHGERFDRAIASDLIRASSTAEIVWRGRLPEVELDSRWREFHFGAWEGLTWGEIVARFPEAKEGPNDGGSFVTPRGGSETFADLVARVEAALASELRRSGGQKLLVVTHAGPLHALLRLACGSESEALRTRFLPASISRFSYGRAGMRVLRTNESASDVAP